MKFYQYRDEEKGFSPNKRIKWIHSFINFLNFEELIITNAEKQVKVARRAKKYKVNIHADIGYVYAPFGNDC